MRRHSLSAFNATISAAARLGDMCAALDGYPASSLVDYCIDDVDVEDATLARRQWLVAHILTQWTEQLARDIEAFPSSGLESFESIRQRMQRAREALLNVRSILLGLGRLAELHEGPGDGMPGLPIEAGRVLRTSPWPRPQAGV